VILPRFALPLAATAALLTGCCLAPEPDIELRPLDVILIVSDDAGWKDFDFQGSPDIPTPNLNRLAACSTRFGQAYVTASVCSPSRAGLLTGRYQQRFGHEFNIGPADAGLPLSERTMADHFGDRGYRTVAIGKWHLGSEDRFHPLERGFEEFVGLRGGSRSYFPMPAGKAGTRRIERARVPVDEEAEFGYVTDYLADAAIASIRAADERPLFLYLAFTAPHTPMHGRPDLMERFGHIEDEGRRKYVAMQVALDEAVGRVLDALDERDPDRWNLVFFLNDNGGATNNHSDNGELRGMKGSKWEGGIRVPMLMRGPGADPSHTSFVSRPFSALDILPTALFLGHDLWMADFDLLDPERLDALGLDGELQFWMTEEPPARVRDRALYWRRGPAAAIRQGKWKLIRVEGQSPLLFDLESDPGERVDRRDAEPERCRELLAALAEWEQEMIAPLWDTGEVWRENQRQKHRMDVIGRAAEREFP